MITLPLLEGTSPSPKLPNIAKLPLAIYGNLTGYGWLSPIPKQAAPSLHVGSIIRHLSAAKVHPRCRQLAAWRPSPTEEEVGKEKDEGYAESIGYELLSEEFLFHLHAARESATLWRYHSDTPGVLTRTIVLPVFKQVIQCFR